MKNIFIIIFTSLMLLSCSASIFSPPVLINGSEPYYPLEAKLKGIEGIVDLILEVSEKGNVSNTRITKSSGYDVLDLAAIDYAKNLIFNPAIRNDKPVSILVTWKVNFEAEAGIDEKEIDPLFNVLVFTKTAGFRHQTIQDGVSALKVLASENNFNVDFTADSTLFNNEVLSKYEVVLFLNTSGNVLGDSEEKALKKFINRGGGFVGIHSATNTEYDWEWYGKLVGAYFDDHPKVQQAIINVVDKNHLSTRHLPDEWKRTDEWYNLRNSLDDNIRVLAVLDEYSYEGGKHKEFHPFTWCHEFDGGRSWVTLGGHTKESYREVLFLKHLLGGIKYAAGLGNNL